jgi:hypothetical protein
MLWQEAELNAKTSALRMVEKKLLIRLGKGYYALHKNYNANELANRIVSPSYVSFQPALAYAGLNFQPQGDIGSVARINKRKIVDGRLYTYAAMKPEIFFNTDGLILRNGAAIASPERAVLDSFYFGFLPDAADLSKLNMTALKRLVVLYPRTVQKKARNLYENPL